MSRVVHVAFRSHDSGGVQYVNTFAAKADPVGPDISEPTLDQIAGGISDWLFDTYRRCLAAAYTWDDIQLREITPLGGEATHGMGFPGMLDPGTGILPKECALILAVKTAQATRSGRGHMALPSPRESSFLASSTDWATGGQYWINVGNFATALLAGHDFTYDGGLATAHLSMRLFSRKHNETYDVTSLVRRPYVRWLESRETAP